MRKEITKLNLSNPIPNWVTIIEAVKIVNQLSNAQITDSDIYRHAIYGDILLSLYFQSPVFLREIVKTKDKIKMKTLSPSLMYRLCYLDTDCFINQINLGVHTKGNFILSPDCVIDTPLAGYEHVRIQRLLAKALKLPNPLRGKCNNNFGISLIISGHIFQAFEKITWQDRIHRQIIKLPLNMANLIFEEMAKIKIDHIYERNFFPLYSLPNDACFVIRRAELEKLIIQYTSAPVSTRNSSALARLFWLACWHNESIRSLIGHPYKLLPIFEQWARDDGITDNLSAETLKAALERGSPIRTPIASKPQNP
ncbi:hypothetical protein OOL67_003655 [Salmonella enterica]|nr:hypothetical protein [Salmonella enterica]EFS3536005.1 hypothetical protein [Salmonella enterica]EGA4955520.1 hypothetical protein [Salmonella enterica]EKC2364580.1 hypothetical protein [Salmonella enterica]EKC2499863.1 hypothetical protein [Salmonella enterica]